MRTHHGRDAQSNWNWEKDDETIAHFRRWSRVHMQLYPYFRAHVRRALETGAPLFAPLALEFPEFQAGWTATDQYLLGERLIVAPVIEEGATSREVQLPESEDFYPLFGGSAVSGTTQVQASVTEIPVFARAGTVLSLAPAEVDTVFEVSDGSDTVSLDDIGDAREIWLYPGGSQDFEEFDTDIELRWDGAGLVQSPDSATYRGESVETTGGELFTTIEIAGSGTLEMGGGTLVIKGVDSGAPLTVRVYHP